MDDPKVSASRQQCARGPAVWTPGPNPLAQDCELLIPVFERTPQNIADLRSPPEVPRELSSTTVPRCSTLGCRDSQASRLNRDCHASCVCIEAHQSCPLRRRCAEFVERGRSIFWLPLFQVFLPGFRSLLCRPHQPTFIRGPGKGSPAYGHAANHQTHNYLLPRTLSRMKPSSRCRFKQSSATAFEGESMRPARRAAFAWQCRTASPTPSNPGHAQ